MHLAAYGIEARPILGFQDLVTIHLMIDGLELNRLCHVPQEIHHLSNLSARFSLSHDWHGTANRLGVPTATSDLEEGKMPSKGRRQTNCVRVRLELFVGNRLLYSNLSFVSCLFRLQKELLDSQDHP